MNDSYALLLVDALNKLADKTQQAIVDKYLTQGKYMNIAGCLTGRFQSKVPNSNVTNSNIIDGDLPIDAWWLKTILPNSEFAGGRINVKCGDLCFYPGYEMIPAKVTWFGITLFRGDITRQWVLELCKLLKVE